MNEIIPKKYPTNLLDKDWSKRKCYWYLCQHEQKHKFLSNVHDMEVRDDDVWLVTGGKCGTTWMQELVWLVLHDFDFEGALSEYLDVRSPYLEFDFILNGDLNTGLKRVEELKSPRFIKSHLSLPLLPAQLWQKKPKTIYVIRNPIDALISAFYHSRRLGWYMDVTLEEYLSKYMDQNGFQYHTFDNAAEFYELRNESWFFYTSYERMKSNLSDVILDVCKFLDKDINEIQMQNMLKHLSFEEMKKNPKTQLDWETNQIRLKKNISNYDKNTCFIRKGLVNGYKEELSKDFRTKMERWLEKNLSERNLSLSDLLLLNN